MVKSIPIIKVLAISINYNNSEEFIIHFQGEHDHLFLNKQEDRENLIRMIINICIEQYNKPTFIHFFKDTSITNLKKYMTYKSNWSKQKSGIANVNYQPFDCDKWDRFQYNLDFKN